MTTEMLDGPADDRPVAGAGGRMIPTINEPEGRTDVANARRLVRRFGDRFRYVAEWRKPIVYTGQRWEADVAGLVNGFAKAVTDDLWREARTWDNPDALRWAAASADARHVLGMVKLALDEVAVRLEDLNADPWLLNTPSGTVDLRTGRVRPHDRADLITTLCPTLYEPEAYSERWEEFVATIFCGRLDLLCWVQRLFGAALPGVVREHVLAVFHGAGANGKSTILEALMHVLGDDLSYKAPADLLLTKSGNSHPTERAALFGKRLVVCTETADGRRLDEALTKELTGGDTITARRMREDFWSFKPSHAVVLCTNHKPRVRGTDNGIWRRLRLVPFDRTFADHEQDKALPERLRGEAPALLAWMVRGCLDWQEQGLGRSESVERATADYRASEDVIGRFIEERCVVRPDVKIRASEFRTFLGDWCDEEDEKRPSSKAVGTYMGSRFEKKTTNGTVYLGVTVQV